MAHHGVRFDAGVLVLRFLPVVKVNEKIEVTRSSYLEEQINDGGLPIPRRDLLFI
jgi:hypothetical protein